MRSDNWPWPPTPSSLRAAFDAAPEYTIGIEDEVMLLAPDTLELTARATDVIELVDGDRRFKLELPASQIEITTPTSSHVREVAAALLAARRTLAVRTRAIVRLGCAGAHPFSRGRGQLNHLPRYEPTIRAFGSIAERQLVCALQVHVAIGNADRALAVYNAARSYLPLLAALAANAPFFEGRDTGLASVRPTIGQLLPRQGVPPRIPSWEAHADIFRWGNATGAFATAQTWWWELRLHPAFGTLEFRVPDAQSTVEDAAAVAAVIQALVGWLSERHDHGEQLTAAPTWQIEENRWSACRHGVEGEMLELETGLRRSTRKMLHELVEQLTPAASRLGADAPLRHARRMIEVNGAIAQRREARCGGTQAVTRRLTEQFLDEPRWLSNTPQTSPGSSG